MLDDVLLTLTYPVAAVHPVTRKNITSCLDVTILRLVFSRSKERKSATSAARTAYLKIAESLVVAGHRGFARALSEEVVRQRTPSVVESPRIVAVVLFATKTSLESAMSQMFEFIERKFKHLSRNTISMRTFNLIFCRPYPWQKPICITAPTFLVCRSTKCFHGQNAPSLLEELSHPELVGG